MEARDLDARTADGDTAMHFAASAGNVDTLRALAECGAAPAPHNNRWETPLDLARLGSFNACAELLVRRVEAVSPKNTRSERVLQNRPLQSLLTMATAADHTHANATPPPSSAHGVAVRGASGGNGSSGRQGGRNLDRTASVKRQHLLDDEAAEQRRLEEQLRMAEAEHRRRQSPQKAGVKFVRQNSVKPGFDVLGGAAMMPSLPLPQQQQQLLRPPGASVSPMLRAAATNGARQQQQPQAAASPGWNAIREVVAEKKGVGSKLKSMVGSFKLRVSGKKAWRRGSGS